MTPDPTDPIRVTMWIRDASHIAQECKSEAVARLHRLEKRGVVDEISVRTWGKQINLEPEPTTGDEEVRQAYEEFVSWAARNGYSLEPAFRRCDRTTLVSEGTTEVLVLPVVCLSVHEGETLTAVFPCSESDGTQTVDDCLSRLEAASASETPFDGGTETAP